MMSNVLHALCTPLIVIFFYCTLLSWFSSFFWEEDTNGTMSSSFGAVLQERGERWQVVHVVHCHFIFSIMKNTTTTMPSTSFSFCCKEDDNNIVCHYHLFLVWSCNYARRNDKQRVVHVACCIFYLWIFVAKRIVTGPCVIVLLFWYFTVGASQAQLLVGVGWTL
jgi:hypothetical protein